MYKLVEARQEERDKEIELEEMLYGRELNARERLIIALQEQENMDDQHEQWLEDEQAYKERKDQEREAKMLDRMSE